MYIKLSSLDIGISSILAIVGNEVGRKIIGLKDLKKECKRNHIRFITGQIFGHNQFDCGFDFLKFLEENKVEIVFDECPEMEVDKKTVKLNSPPLYNYFFAKKITPMEEVTIYKYQLEAIKDALRLTANMHDSRKGRTCFDRQVKQAEQYAINALNGRSEVKYVYK